jgi:2-amino-4-hydroxy-6-hydroxymethyldihydropteridine diphosphokinase
VWRLNDQELWHKAYIALGSNMGDRESCLMTALDLLKEDKDRIHLIDISNIYETAPVGYTGQGNFLNMVCHVSTFWEPHELLSALQKIETKLGRKRFIQWGPRTMDLDLLIYDDIEICSETLTVPHPRMFERAFVLTPLQDVYPSGHIKGRLFDDLIKECEDKSGIKLFRITKE